MDWKALAGPLTDAGLTLLGSAIGGPAGGIATAIGKEVANALGVNTPREAVEVIRTEPQAVQALREYEAMHAEQLALLANEQRTFADILARDSDKGFFWDAWRPAMMWMLILLWVWSIVIIPTLNAAAGLMVPLPPFETLFGVTAVLSAFYMGGNTAIRLLNRGGK